MSIQLKNINKWKVLTREAKDKIQSSANVYVQARVKEVYNMAMKVSPQWSGNFAYNWRIEIKGYRGDTYDTTMKVTPYWDLRGSTRKQGDLDGLIHQQMLYAYEVIKNIKWNSKVTLVNRAPIAEDLEAGRIRLRPENRHYIGDPSQPLTRSKYARPDQLIPPYVGVITYLKTRYQYLNQL